MNPISRALRVLPPGTAVVGAGMVVLGAASYVHLAGAGHALGSDGMDHVSLLWTVVMSLGLGVFFPVEQELTRIVAARSARGEGIGPVVRSAVLATGGGLAVLLAVLAGCGSLVADRLFDGSSAMVLAMGAAFAGMAFCYVLRGVLAGMGRFGAYGLNLAIDGGVRIALAVGLAVGGVHSPLAFGLVLAVAPAVAAAVSLPSLRGTARPGPAMGPREFAGGLGLLVCSSLLAQAVVNLAVISTKLLEPGESDLVVALLAALVLARVPLFVFGSLQASLLSGLAGAAAVGDHRGFRRLLTRTSAVVCLLGVAGGVSAVALGPWIIRVFFNAPDVLGPLDFVWLSAGTVCYMLAMVFGQAAMTLGRHRLQLAAWALGTAVLVGVTLVPGAIRVRVEVAYAAGSLAVVIALLFFLAAALRRHVVPGAAAPAAEDMPADALARPRHR